MKRYDSAAARAGVVLLWPVPCHGKTRKICWLLEVRASQCSACPPPSPRYGFTRITVAFTPRDRKHRLCGDSQACPAANLSAHRPNQHIDTVAGGQSLVVDSHFSSGVMEGLTPRTAPPSSLPCPLPQLSGPAPSREHQRRRPRPRRGPRLRRRTSWPQQAALWAWTRTEGAGRASPRALRACYAVCCQGGTVRCPPLLLLRPPARGVGGAPGASGERPQHAACRGRGRCCAPPPAAPPSACCTAVSPLHPPKDAHMSAVCILRHALT